jgi:hypothetical protein
MPEPTQYPDAMARDEMRKAPQEASPIEQAIGYTADRLERLEMVLATLHERLAPVCGENNPAPGGSERAGIRTSSRVGDRVAAFGHAADRLADQVVELTGRLEV